MSQTTMHYIVFTLFLYFQYGHCTLWPKGVVHFTINKKDYDIHSEDVITSAFADIEREICVKFFNTPPSHNSTDRILYINNPDKRKNCAPDTYNFTGNVVDMVIGYKCIDPKSIVRIVVDMLRASIMHTVPIINSYDLIRKFQELEEDPSRPFLLSPKDRNYINAHYHTECGSLAQRGAFETRRAGGAVSMSQENEMYYKDKLWPLGVVMYGIEDALRNSKYHVHLKYAMTTIELASCVVFQEVLSDNVLKPKSLIWFGTEGEAEPVLGFQQGNQILASPLLTTIDGAPGHTAHTLNLLMRALGVPMASSRHDRDNYVIVNWNHVDKGKEHLLEKAPAQAWLRDARLPYDFDSATHAPANFVCRSCKLGETTVQPAQDNLWQRTLTMGHRTELSAGDKEVLSVLYNAPCRARYVNNRQ